jgi:hypothetical protein
MVIAALELPLCGVVCAASPTDRIMAAAANVPDRTIVLMLSPLFLMLPPLFRTEGNMCDGSSSQTTIERISNLSI